MFFDATEDLAVRGDFAAGATIGAGVSLLVQGDLRGTLVIRDEGRLILGGTLGAFVDQNEGTLSVAGKVATPLEMIPGAVHLAAGTAVTLEGRTQILAADGSTTPVMGVTEIALGRTEVTSWNKDTGRFTQIRADDFVRLVSTFWARLGERRFLSGIPIVAAWNNFQTSAGASTRSPRPCRR